MSDVNRIDVSADFQDITITLGEYGDDEARLAFSVTDAGGDGSLAYNNTTGVFTYTGPSAAEVRAHFSAGTGISLVNGVITNTSVDTNTTYTQNASAATGGANLNLIGSDSTTDTVKFASGTGMSVTRIDDSTINIATTITQYTDTLARQAISVAVNTGDGDLTYNNTNGQFSYAGPTATDYRLAISVGSNTGDGDLTYNNTNGQFSYAGPTSADYRAAVSAANSGTGYGALSYDSGSGVFTYARVTDANIRGAVSATNSGTGYGSLSYDSGTGAFTYAKVTDANIRGAVSVNDTGGDGSLAYDSGTGVITYAGPTAANYRAAISVTESGTGYGGIAYDSGTGVITFTGVTGADIRTEVQDGRNLTYTSSTLNLDKSLVDVNSITAETAQDLSLVGDSIVLLTRDVSTASNTLIIDSQGYNFDLNDNGDAAARITIKNVGAFSKTLYSMLLGGEVTLGSNQITGAFIVDNQAVLNGGDVLSWNTYNMVGYPFIEASLGLGDIFPPGTTVSSVSVDPGDPTLATLTMTANALQTISLDLIVDYAYLSHVGYSSDWSTVVLVDGFNGSSGYTANTITRTSATVGVPSPIVLTTNTGYVDGAKAVISAYSWTNSETNIDVGARRTVRLRTENSINEHINIPFGLGVGPDAISTNRGYPSDTVDAIGINLLNNGKVEGYTGKTLLNLTVFKNNSSFVGSGSGTGTNPTERAGGQFVFNTFAGNADTTLANRYLTSGDGMGSITWFAQPATATSASSTITPASISVRATETHDTSSKQGAGLYLQNTANNVGAAQPRTFLSADDTTVRLQGDTIVLASRPTARNLAATGATTFATINSTAININANTRVTGGLRTYGEFACATTTYGAGIPGFNIPAQNTIYAMPLDTTNASNGTSISNTSRINISRSGFYKIIMSLQITLAGSGSAAGQVDFWLRKNGADVANSKTQIDLLKDQKAVIAMDWLVESDGDDYFEIVYVGTTSNYADIAFPTIAATTTPYVSPVAPALLVNVIPVGV